MMGFLYPTKTKLITFAALMTYFGLAAVYIMHPTLQYESHGMNVIVVPAFMMMVIVGKAFELQRFFVEGKGPGYSNTEIVSSYVEASIFGILVLYLIACIVGSGIERHRLRIAARSK